MQLRSKTIVNCNPTTKNVMSENVIEVGKLSSQIKAISTKDKQTLENDLSMISINDDSQNCRYFLPSSQDFKNPGVTHKFSEDAKTRRQLNRDLTVDKLRKYKMKIYTLSYRDQTGRTCILEIMDNIVDQECSCLPLGSNFLEGTNVTSQQRNSIVDRLYESSSELNIERYTVSNAMAMFDRYVTRKGKNLIADDLTILAMTCLYIACKNDLIQYPHIDQMYEIFDIEPTIPISKLEAEVINVIDFNICNPTPILFLRPLTVIKQRVLVSHSLAKVLCELCTSVYELAGHPSHVQACASYFISLVLSFRKYQPEAIWTPIIRFVTGLDCDDIRPVIVTMAKYLLTEKVKLQFPLLYNEHRKLFDIFPNRKEDLKKIITGKQ